jgi:hypothetical protein
MLTKCLKTIRLLHNDIFFPNCYFDTINIIANIKHNIKK